MCKQHVTCEYGSYLRFLMDYSELFMHTWSVRDEIPVSPFHLQFTWKSSEHSYALSAWGNGLRNTLRGGIIKEYSFCLHLTVTYSKQLFRLYFSLSLSLKNFEQRFECWMCPQRLLGIIGRDLSESLSREIVHKWYTPVVTCQRIIIECVLLLYGICTVCVWGSLGFTIFKVTVPAEGLRGHKAEDHETRDYNTIYAHRSLWMYYRWGNLYMNYIGTEFWNLRRCWWWYLGTGKKVKFDPPVDFLESFYTTTT